jgi:hypothetical protein
VLGAILLSCTWAGPLGQLRASLADPLKGPNPQNSGEFTGSARFSSPIRPRIAALAPKSFIVACIRVAAAGIYAVLRLLCGSEPYPAPPRTAAFPLPLRHDFSPPATST